MAAAAHASEEDPSCDSFLLTISASHSFLLGGGMADERLGGWTQLGGQRREGERRRLAAATAHGATGTVARRRAINKPVLCQATWRDRFDVMRCEATGCDVSATGDVK